MIFDYIIIGGGSAGASLAGRLSEDSASQVLLLEAGPPDTSPLIHCPAGLAAMSQTHTASERLHTVPQSGLNGRRGLQPRGRTLGGSSSTNAMVYVRGHPLDYDAWESMGNPDWGWDSVFPWFIKAENNSHLGAPWHGQNGPLNIENLREPNIFSQRFVEAGIQAGWRYNDDFNGPEQEGVGHYQVTQKAGERCSAAKAYLTPHIHRPNLHVMTKVIVDRIAFENKRATKVHAWRGSKALTLQAKNEIILSAGAFHSPAILLRSGIGPSEHLQALNIPVVHDLPGVGANLHDHPDVILVVGTPKASELFGLTPLGALQLVRDIWQWQKHRQGRLTTNFAEAGAFLKSSSELKQPDVQMHFVTGKLVDHGQELVFGYGFSLHVCALQPLSRGTVRLQDSSAHSAPLIDPQFLSHPDDVQVLMRGLRCARKILKQAPLAHYGHEWKRSANVQSDQDLEQWIRNNTDTIYHPVGTCKMGQDAEAVVDTKLRVHGVQGLRVVDASVMPRIVSGNTNAPTIMIAERAADWIRQAVAERAKTI